MLANATTIISSSPITSILLLRGNGYVCGKGTVRHINLIITKMYNYNVGKYNMFNMGIWPCLEDCNHLHFLLLENLPK